MTGFWGQFSKRGNSIVFYWIFGGFLTFGSVIIKDLFVVLVYQLDINQLDINILQDRYIKKIAIFMAPSSVTSRHKSWLLRAFIEHLQFQICDFILIMLTVKCLIWHITIWEGAKRPFILLYFILMISLLTLAL